MRSMKMYHVHCDLEYIVKNSLNSKCLEFLTENNPLINEDSEAVFILFSGGSIYPPLAQFAGDCGY